jgi:hypothetical protein
VAHLQSPARARQGEVEASNPNLDVPPFRRNEPTAARGWRDHIKVHSAADLFPMMSEEELAGLTKDIEDKGGLIHPVVFCGDELLDGRNRIEAVERSGLLDIECLKDKDCLLRTNLAGGIDPYEYVLAANIQRRHLTEEQRRELIAKIIKAKPSASDRTIAKQVKRDHKTVAKIRKKLESTGEVSPVEKRVGADGKKRRGPKPKAAIVKTDNERDRKTCVELNQKALDAERERARWLVDHPRAAEQRATGSAEVDVEQRRARMAALDNSESEELTPEQKRSGECRDKLIDAIRTCVPEISLSDMDDVVNAWTSALEDRQRPSGKKTKAPR